MTATVRKTLNFSPSLELLPAFPTSPATNLTPRPKLVTFGTLHLNLLFSLAVP